jgi:4-hydroxybenzoate polyprenyltransferase
MSERVPSTVVALALSTHPGPTVAVTAVTAILAVGVGVPPVAGVLVTAAVFLGQVSVGLSNDWIDAERDAAVGRRDKPIARGWVDAGLVRTVSVVTALLAVLLTVPIGWAVTAAHVVFIASAWSYNAWLKRTPLSVLPFIVSFGLLPAIVTLAAQPPWFAPPTALGAGALLGVAAHFSNVLPDLADDRATGIVGLPHRLGRRASGGVIGVALAAASVLVFAYAFGAGGDGAGAEGVLPLAGLVVTLGLAVACIALAVTRKPTRLLFQLIMAAALLNVALLALAS